MIPSSTVRIFALMSWTASFNSLQGPSYTVLVFWKKHFPDFSALLNAKNRENSWCRFKSSIQELGGHSHEVIHLTSIFVFVAAFHIRVFVRDNVGWHSLAKSDTQKRLWFGRQLTSLEGHPRWGPKRVYGLYSSRKRYQKGTN